MTVTTYPDHRTGRRGHTLSVSPVKLLGHSLNLDVHAIPASKSEFKTWNPPAPFYPLINSRPPPHHLLVTASFGRILRKPQLELFSESRRLNVHPSLLPAYRGPAPIQRALINDEKELGVCIIDLSPPKIGIDCGNIWDQRTIAVPANVKFAEMRDTMGKMGGELLVSVLRKLLSEKAAVSTPQRDDVKASRAPMILFEDTMVDPMTMSAPRIARIYRAIQRPLVIKFRRDRNAKDVKLVQLHGLSVIEPELDLKPEPGFAAYNRRSHRLVVGCSEGTYLEVESLKEENRKLVTALDWWNGMSPIKDIYIKLS